MRFEFTDLELRVIYYALNTLPPNIRLLDTTTQEVDAAASSAALKIEPSFVKAMKRAQSQPKG